MKNKISYPFISLSLLVFGLTACGHKKEEKQAAKLIIPTVAITHALQQRPEYELTLPGELVPYEQTTIYPKIKGFVKHIYADRGSHVTKGQLLATLEAPEVNERYQSSRSEERKYFEDYQYSRQAYERLAKAAQKQGAVAAIELERAKSKLRADSAAYASARSSAGASGQLSDYLRIRAPFSGIIVQRNISEGALVGDNMATSLFVIAQNQRLRLTLAVPEKHAASINEQTTAVFTLNDQPGKKYKAILSRNGKLLQQDTRSVTVEMDVQNKDMSLNGGEYAQVTLHLKRPQPTWWVPATSVVHAQSGVFVLAVTDGRVQRLPVTEGIRKGKLQEVFADLQPETMMVLNGTEELEEGIKVNVKN